ncbi:MAG: glycosyltransferase family 2 protein [Caldilineaceae bacterium]
MRIFAKPIPTEPIDPPQAIDISIIIVSWNVWDLLRACLASIERASQPMTADAESDPANLPPIRGLEINEAIYTLEVIVVDNASSDASADLIPARFPWVHLIRSAENLGFTKGNNLGYAQAQGRFIYFLNPDTELADESLARLLRAIVDEPTVGMVGPRLRYGDGMTQNSRRRFPTRLTGFFESTWLSQWWPSNPWAVHMHMLDWPDDQRHDVDWLVGAAMLARRTALEQIRPPDAVGPFDEGFFMYSEELDLCKRIKEAGWRIVFVPEALVVHYEGRSSGQVVAARHIHFNRSKVRYYEKYFGHAWAEAFRRFLLCEFRWQRLLERCKRLLRHKRTLRSARIAVYDEVIESALTPNR